MRESTLNLVRMAVAGAIVMDLVLHPEGITRMLWEVVCFAEGRCSKCGYKLDHPFVRHEAPWVGHNGELDRMDRYGDSERFPPMESVGKESGKRLRKRRPNANAQYESVL